MKKGLIIIACAFFTTNADAEPVRVSAGGHLSFTRVVLDFESLPRWESRRIGNRLSIRFLQSERLNFDLSRVFRLIDRKRIADVRALDGNTIEIEISCDCSIVSKANGNSALIVDVRDRKQDPSELEVDKFAAPLPNPRSNPSVRPPPRSNALEGEGAPDQTAQPPSPLFTQLGGIPVSPYEPSQFGLDLELADSGSDSVAVDLMGQAFSRATIQGLVVVDPDAPSSSEVRSNSMSDGLDERRNISVTTSFDRVIKPVNREIAPTQTGAVCLPDKSLNILAWGNPNETNSLGKLRTAAMREDGSVHEDGALALARFYLSLGFGSEAKITASLLPDSKEKTIINAIAEIMDEGRTADAIFDEQVYCDGSVALWSLLAKPIASSNAPRSSDAILANFSSLQPHLRAHLGPLLTERLREAGLSTEARTALNAVTRGGHTSDESDLANARLELGGSRAEDARERLSELASATDLTAAEALLELLEDAEAREMAPSPAWVDDVPTLVAALEGTEIAKELNLAGLRGLVHLGRFTDFRNALAEESPGVSDEIRRTYAKFALESAVETADDIEFITNEIALNKLVPPESLKSSKRFEISKRLNSMGIASRALLYLPSEAATLQELQVLVEVLISNGEPEKAAEIAAGSGIFGKSALVAASLRASGKDEQSIEPFMEIGDITQATSAALRTAQWEWIARNGETALANATQVLASEPGIRPSGESSKNGELIKSSREVRARARSLLQLTELSGVSKFTN